MERKTIEQIKCPHCKHEVNPIEEPTEIFDEKGIARDIKRRCICPNCYGFIKIK